MNPDYVRDEESNIAPKLHIEFWLGMCAWVGIMCVISFLIGRCTA